MRNSLKKRLNAKRAEVEVPRNSVDDQLISQWLAALGSFGTGGNLFLIYDFCQGSSIGANLNALEAAARLVRRECESISINNFFLDRTDDLRKRVLALALLRHINPETESLLWASVELLTARLGHESMVLESLAKDFPTICRRLLVEIARAEKLLH